MALGVNPPTRVNIKILFSSNFVHISCWLHLYTVAMYSSGCTVSALI